MITITGYSGPGGDLRIPETTNGMPIIGIGDSAFRDSLTLTSVTLGSNVTTVGQSAFSGCFNLAEATFYGSVASIGSYAFYGTRLSTVTLPDSVTSIGSAAFLGCSHLTALSTGPANLSFRSDNGVLFDKPAARLIQYPGGRLGPYALPPTVAVIGDYAFSSCAGLTAITIPPSTTLIGNDAFDNCTGLTNVVMGTNVAEIGLFAFWNCSRLPTIALPASVTNLHDFAFYTCPALTSITVQASNPAYSSADGVLFDKAQALLLQYPGGKTGAYAIPATVTVVGAHAFDNCALLTGLTLGASVINVGDYAFGHCTGLTDLTIPRGVRHIGDHAFDGCSKVTRLFFLGDAPSLGLHALDLATNVTVYYLPEATGWTTADTGRPTVAWNPQVKADAAFGVAPGGFGFTIAGNSNLVVVLEATTSLENPVWLSLGSNVLTGGAVRFSDPQWSFYSSRYYRFRSP